MNDRLDTSTRTQSVASIPGEQMEAIAGWRRRLKEHVAHKGQEATDDSAGHLSSFLRFMAEDNRMARLESLIEAQRSELDLFEVLRIQDSELAHSNFLAWLLDPAGNHELEHHFLRGFLELTAEAAIQRDISAVCPARLESIDWSDIEVRREWQFIDILVLSEKSEFVCAIENKIWADEGIGESGKSQLTVYRKVLEREFPGFKTHLVFLSPGGMESSDSTEREYWIPENYRTVRHLIAQCLREFDGIASQEVLTLMDQYDRTLRRNIVPESSEVGALAVEIYLEHRDAIEFISRNKPDYRAGIKEILKEAIRSQEGWVLCAENPQYIRFTTSDWDEFEELKTGTSWASDSDSLLLFEFWCPPMPTSTEGPSLTLGQGTDKNLRRHLIETALQNKDIFQVRSVSLEWECTYIHEFKRDLVRDADLGTGWHDGPVRQKLMEWVECFATEDFPRINQAVIKSLKEYRTGSLKSGE